MHTLTSVPQFRRDSAVALANRIADAAAGHSQACMTRHDLVGETSWRRMAITVAGVGRLIGAGKVSPNVILADAAGRNRKPMTDYASELLSQLPPVFWQSLPLKARMLLL
jgi:hypothetical protein